MNIRDERDNAFDLIRLLLAACVLWTHGALLGGFTGFPFENWLMAGQTNLGFAAVAGFFGLSGFLVANSFASDPCPRRFLLRRAKRILPGYYACLVVTAFGLAPLIGLASGLPDAWAVSDAWSYLWKNVLVRVGEWHVGGVLGGLPYEGSINGSLWTLFPEICAYLVLAGLGVCGLLVARRGQLLIAGVLLFILHLVVVLRPDVKNLAPSILALTGYSSLAVAFFTGVLAYAFREELNLGGGGAPVWCASVLLILKFGGWALVGPVMLPLALIQAGQWKRVRLPFDFSYGLYIYHFPLFHLLAALGLNRVGAVGFFALGLAASLVAAALSWFMVERPFLRRSRVFVTMPG